MMFEQRAEEAGNISCIIYKTRTLFRMIDWKMTNVFFTLSTSLFE